MVGRGDDVAIVQSVAVLADVGARDVVRRGSATRCFWAQPGCIVVRNGRKSREEEQWSALASTWVSSLQPLLGSSPFFKDLGDSVENCLRVFLAHEGSWHSTSAFSGLQALDGFRAWNRPGDAAGVG